MLLLDVQPLRRFGRIHRLNCHRHHFKPQLRRLVQMQVFVRMQNASTFYHGETKTTRTPTVSYARHGLGRFVRSTSRTTLANYDRHRTTRLHVPDFGPDLVARESRCASSVYQTEISVGADAHNQSICDPILTALELRRQEQKNLVCSSIATATTCHFASPLCESCNLTDSSTPRAGKFWTRPKCH